MRTGVDLHLYLNEETKAKLENLQSFLKKKYGTANLSITSKSAVIRNAIDFYYSYNVLGESKIHPKDPRFNK